MEIALRCLALVAFGLCLNITAARWVAWPRALAVALPFRGDGHFASWVGGDKWNFEVISITIVRGLFRCVLLSSDTGLWLPYRRAVSCVVSREMNAIRVEIATDLV